MGICIAWAIAYIQPSAPAMIISIIFLQIIIEYLVVRNYAITMIFITILTVFLAESGQYLTTEIDEVFFALFVNILIGSAIGMLGGWVLFNERLNNYVGTKFEQENKA